MSFTGIHWCLLFLLAVALCQHCEFTSTFVCCLRVVASPTMSLVPCCVLVSRLTEHVTKDQIRESFASFGTVASVVWKFDPEGEHTGRAYVIFQE